MHHHAPTKLLAKRKIKKHRTLNTAGRKHKNRRTEEKKKANITIGIDTTISWPGSVIDVHYIGSTQGYVVVERWQAQKEPREV